MLRRSKLMAGVLVAILAEAVPEWAEPYRWKGRLTGMRRFLVLEVMVAALAVFYLFRGPSKIEAAGETLKPDASDGPDSP